MGNDSLSKKKKFLFSVMTTCIAGALLYVILELGLARYFSAEESANWIRFDALRGWALTPGEYRAKPLYRFTQFNIHINDLGLRSHAPRTGTTYTSRLLVLGDSFTFAKETRTENLFTQRLQNLLDAGHRGVEVLNGGVPAYGTAQELLFMKELNDDHHLNPKAYLLVFFTNDILDNLCLSYGNLIEQPVRPCFALSPEGSLVLKAKPRRDENWEDDTLVPRRQERLGFRTLALARSLGEDWLQTRPRAVRLLERLGVSTQVWRVPGLLNAWYRDDIVRTGGPLTAALVTEMSAEARRHGGQLVAAMVPSPLQVYPATYLPMLRRSFEGNPLVERFAEDPLRPQTLVRGMCEAAGIPFEDLLPLFREKNDTTLFIPRDGHLTDDGHELAAKGLLAFLGRHVLKEEK